MDRDTGVAEVVAAWHRGALGRGEFVSRIIELFSPGNVDDILSAVPDESRSAVVERMRAIAAAPGPWLWIGGGSWSYEREPDPERRAGMKTDVARAERELSSHFESTVIPAIRDWLQRQA